VGRIALMRKNRFLSLYPSVAVILNVTQFLTALLATSRLVEFVGKDRFFADWLDSINNALRVS